MKYYAYNEYDEDEGIKPPIVVSEQQILNEYWLYWKNQMKALGRENLISKKNCIDDWIMVNWAWEVEAPT